MARNIPGLNNQLYAPMVTARGANAEAEYMNYKSVVSPLQKKLMYPTMLGAMFADPMYARPLLEKFGPKGLASKVEASGALGAISGLSVLLPRALSEGYKSRRLAHERSYAKQLGAVGSASRLLDSLSSLRNLMTLPGYTAQMLGHGSGLLRHTPRLEHFLTGQTKNVLREGASGANTGGILSSAYGGAKNLGDFLTGGHISGAITAGAKKGGIAGTLSSGAGLLDKGISGLLSSPSGVMFGLMGAQIGLGIYKSIKLAKLQPNRQPPDKFARRFYSPSSSQTAINRILALAGGGKVDPQTLSFMVQQVQLSELQRLNMQMAGLRGEYHSENDFIRQEKEKGTDRAFDEYGREVLGEDDRSGVSKVLDKLEHGLHTFKAKYDPIAQLVNFGVGLLGGKIITPKSETSRIADAYGYSDEKEMLKDRAEQFSITADQTRLLHTTSKAILQMAPTYEGKMLAILSASYDIQRMIASEAVTIRTGMGFDKNIMYTEEKGFFGRMVSGITGAISNIPGLNAIGNIITGTGKFIKGAAAIPHRVFEKGKEAIGKTRDYFFGDAYTKLKDKDEWAKAAGLYISDQDKAFDYVGNGLPNQMERIRSVLFDIYYIQEAMLQEMGGEVTKADERLIWSPTEKRYVTLQAAIALEESQKIQLEATRERAFREGPLGKMLFVADLLSTPAGRGFFNNLSQKVTVGRSLERMHGAERVTGAAEIALSGEPSTFETSRAMTEILSDISSIKSTMATAVHSMAEIESERQLERTPEDIGWQIRAALSVAGVVAGTLLGGPAGWVGAGAAGIAFLKARQEREKEIAEQREMEIGTRNILERGVEIQEEYFAKSYEERFGVDLLNKSNQSIIDGLTKVTKQEQMLDQLKIIASYLGDKNGSVYELLEPGPRIAEVTIVDRDGKSIFIDNIMPPQITQQILILQDIRDYLGGKPYSISNLLDPNQPDIAQVQLLNAAAKGGPVDKDKPVLVGEEGPEILMPRSAGMIIPNDQIDKFADGGTFKGEIFGKIYQKLSDIFSVNFDSLKLDIDQGKKEEKDALQLTMVEKLQALKERMQEKEEKAWKTSVVDLLTGILKKSDKTKEKIKEKGKSLWDFLLDNWKTILAGALVGLGALLAKIFKEEIQKFFGEISKWLKEQGMSIIEQLKFLGRTAVGGGLAIGQWGKGVKGKLPSWMQGPVRKVQIPTPTPETPISSANGANLKEYFAQNEAKRAAWEADQKAIKEAKTISQAGKFEKMKYYAQKGISKVGEFVKTGGISKVMHTNVSTITEPIMAATTKVLGPIKSVITFMGEAFAPITKLLKPLARTVGRLALPLQIVMTAFDFISDTMEGYKEGGLWGAVRGFIAGPMKDDMKTTLGQIGKWAGAGMLAGMVGGPIGVLAGGLFGAAFGAIVQSLKSAYMSYQKGGLWEGVKQLFLGDKEGGLKSAIKTMGPYALAGFVAGSFFPVVGNIAGALIGAAIGGVIGWLGQFKIGNFFGDLINAMSEYGPNPYIIKLFENEGMKYAPMFAKGMSVIPLVGPLVGGLLGSVVDLFRHVFSAVPDIISWAGEVLNSGNSTVVGWFQTKYAAEYAGMTKDSGVPILSPLIYGSIGALVDFYSSIFSKIGDIWSSISTWLAEANQSIIDKQTTPYAKQFAQYGAFTVPVLGPIVGAMFGSLVDVGALIGDKLSGILSPVYEWLAEANQSIINKQTGKYAKQFAEYGTVVPIIGPIVGGMVGTLVDVFSGLWSFISRVPEIAMNWIKSGFKAILPDSVYNALFGNGSETPKVDEKTGKVKREGVLARVFHAKEDIAAENRVVVQKRTPEQARTPAGTPGGTPPPTAAANKVTNDEKKYYDEYNKKWLAAKTEDRKKLEEKYFKEKAARASQSAIPAGTPGGTPPPTVAATKTTPAPKDTVSDIPSPPGSIAAILKEASAATGAPLDIMQKMAYTESKFDPNAKAKTSTASGLFQFIKDTWNSMLKRKGKKHGLSPDTSPFDARANALMGGEFLQENIDTIKGSVLAPPPTAADVYAAHFMGAGGAKQLFREIKKNPNTIAAEVFSKEASANPNIFYVNGDKSRPRTVRQVYEVLAQKMAVDPGPALAKAGTGLTAGEKVEEFGYKAVEKAKDIFGILSEWGSKIKDAFMEALTRQFAGPEATKKPLAGNQKQVKDQKNKIAEETSKQAQADLAASKVSSTPHKIIENYIAERHLIILANKVFQNYYNTHVMSSSKKGKKGSKLSAGDIKTAAITIAREEFLNNPNAESVGMVANLPYVFNPDTAPFKEYLVDSKSSIDTKKSEDEIAKGLRERAEKEASLEDKKPSDNNVVGAVTPKAISSKDIRESGQIGKLDMHEEAHFQSLSDVDKLTYLKEHYKPGQPIPTPLRNEAKRLGFLTAKETTTTGIGGITTTRGKTTQISDKDLDDDSDIVGAVTPSVISKKILTEDDINMKKLYEGLTPTERAAVDGLDTDLKYQISNISVKDKKDYIKNMEEPASSQYGAIRNPAKTTAIMKEAGTTMKTPPEEIAKTDKENKQEAAKKLAQLQSTIKPASQKITPTGLSQSVPRVSGNLGTSVSGPIDELLENLFNHTLLNDLNKIYPTSYAV